MKRPKFAQPLNLVEGKRQWYRIENHGPGQPADVYVYDEIGYWGVMAADFVAELAGVTASDITLHVNSPGGDVFDGIAIMQALRDHPAQVTVKVDALAASIASVIAMAGDRIVMGRNAQMMIHDASGLCVGNAADMAEMQALLDKISDNIATVYADRAGGDASAWRDTMRAETWYSAQEAVDAGLADEVAATPDREEQDALAAVAQWDLSIYRHPGRAAAPAPAARAAVEPGEAVPPTAAASPAQPDAEQPADHTDPASDAPTGTIEIKIDGDGSSEAELIDRIRDAIRTRAEHTPDAPADPEAPSPDAPAAPTPQDPADHTEPTPETGPQPDPETPDPAAAEQGDDWDQATAHLTETDDDEFATLTEALL